MTTDFAKQFFKQIQKDDESVFLAANGDSSAEFSEWIDTGSYSINALISGSIFGGIANTKRVMFAALSGVGKTFLCLSAAKTFLDTYPDGVLALFDTEAAITKQMLVDRGMDAKRIMIIEPRSVERFRSSALKICQNYLATPKENRPRMMFMLDSLGNLSTEKEIRDTEADTDTKDMTRPGLLKGAFRMLNGPMAQGEIPMLIANHLYVDIPKSGKFTAYEINGGSGARYCADTIVYMTKSQDKNTTTNEVVGTIITATTNKSRFTKEKAKVQARISFTGGLDRYYGLVDIALRGGVFKNMSKKIFIDGVTGDKGVFESEIERNPTKYFTPEILQKIDVAAGQLFKFGGALNDLAEVTVDDDIELLTEVAIEE